jgi:hypothetical protein
MGKNQDPGSGINIPDPQNCVYCISEILNENYGTGACHTYRYIILQRRKQNVGLMYITTWRYTNWTLITKYKFPLIGYGRRF